MGFSAKEGEIDIWSKKYPIHNNYEIIVKLRSVLKDAKIDWGHKIKVESEATSSFAQGETKVVLECVNRLLGKGYKPEDITLEKKWKLGHQEKGRLDVFVAKNKKAFLMIECKTWGGEFEKELKNLGKDGGQLFGYFQQDTKAEQIMLYASRLHNGEIEYRNEIVKIEESYRETSNVKDLYERWNKSTKTNGVFEDWVTAYEFQSKSLTLGDLKEIKQEDSSFIFNRFLEILRHNVVSDKPNAFNKIFTLFLCKIKDEDKNPNEELEFQWIEGVDDHISFQKRLTDLYRKGMWEFLKKEVTDFSDDDFNKEFPGLEEKTRKKLLAHLTKVRLQKNNEFAIKEVFDEETFVDNGMLIKEVVDLLQYYKFRYNKKQPFLGDFFELLLTTGLKQESGQFFTPVPIARFICKSVPLKEVIKKKLKTGETDELLPNLIDYAAGSGHFLTESMEEIQNIIEKISIQALAPSAQREIDKWTAKPFDWAYKYIFGIELDYRLVKTSKVGCYLHGDGIANVIHGDGLANFASKNYRGKLENKDGEQDNPKFDFVLSNPPYSVSAFKGNMKNEQAKDDFDLHSSLTDQSSEIECLFVERTKQLLKEGGVAAIILPSSILSNTGIYTKTREILLKYFEFIAITELGSGTFMATGTNTVILFLRRRNNFDWRNIKSSIEQFSHDFRDVTVQGIENVFSKYVSHVWEGVSFTDYVSVFGSNPSEVINNHEIYQEYTKKLKVKNAEELQEKIIEIEKEKLLYFILTYSQKVVLIKTGEKKEEKAFLGYEFSFRKGCEGIHPIQRGKSIDECTKLFDPEDPQNFEKSSAYILEAFSGDVETEVCEDLKKNIFRHELVDMMTFDRVDFEKNISLSAKKKVKIESKWDVVMVGAISEIRGGNGFPKEFQNNNDNFLIPFYKVSDMNSIGNGKYMSISSNYVNEDILKEKIMAYIFPKDTIIFPKVGRAIDTNKKRLLSERASIDNNVMGVMICDDNVLPRYVFEYFSQNIELIDLSSTANPPSINASTVSEIKIPLPPKDIQENIVKEIEEVEKIGEKKKKEIEKL